MPFWTAVDGKAQDPKRESRFIVSIGALNDGSNNVWYAKSFTKPQATIKPGTHKYLNHTFKYPGSVEWSDCTVEFIDPTNPIDAAGSIAQLLEAMGYQIPLDGGKTSESLFTISKRKSVGALGQVAVASIDDMGVRIETWNLEQPWVNKFEWGSYKYAGDELLSLKLTFTYDWASCVLGQSGDNESEALSALAPTTTSFFKDPTPTR